MSLIISVAIILLVIVTSPNYAVTCGLYGASCISPTSYQSCININGEDILTGLVTNCPFGSICNELSLNPCVATPPPTTAPPPTTVPPPDVSPPNCTSEAWYPGPQCNQYYHCFPVLWYWGSELLTCPTGQAFDSVSHQCIVSASCNVV